MLKSEFSFVIYISIFLMLVLPFSPALSQEVVCKENPQSSECQKCISNTISQSDNDSIVGLICYGDANAYVRPFSPVPPVAIPVNVGGVCGEIFSSDTCPIDPNVYRECLSLADESANGGVFEELWERHEEAKRWDLDQMCAPDSLPWVQKELAGLRGDFGAFVPENFRRFDDCLSDMQSEYHQKIREFSEPGQTWSVFGHNRAVRLAAEIDDIRARAILSESFGFGNKITNLLGRVEADLAYCE